MNSTLASPAWQAVLFGFAGVFLLWQIYSGWRRGVVRSALGFVAFVLSALIGFAVGQFVGSVLGRFMPGYGFFFGLAVGLLLTVAILVVALFLSAVLFKRTGQQPGGIRLLYGLGGAFFGLLTGLAVLWGGISIIRATGTIVESVADARDVEAPPMAQGFVKLKDSLELGPAGEAVSQVDAVSPQVYDTISRVGWLLSDPDAMVRFMDAPGIRDIAESPQITGLINDPSVSNALHTGNFLLLMQNPKVLSLASDPKFAEMIRRVDLQKALDYAVPPAQAAPTPARKTP